MLRLFAMLRHMHYGSPTRERREIAFANPPKDPVSPSSNSEPDKSNEWKENADAPQQSKTEPIATAMAATNLEVQGLLGNLDKQAILETLQTNLRGSESFQNMLTREDTLRELDVASIASSLGILNKFKVAGITFSADPKANPEEYKQELLSKILNYEAIGGLTPGERYRFLEALIERYPEATLALHRSVMARLERYREQEQFLEFCKENFGGELISEAAKIIQNPTEQETANPLWEAPSIERSVAKLAQTIPNLQGKIDQYIAKLKRKPVGSQDPSSILREALSRAVNAVSQTQEFGAKHWGIDAVKLWGQEVKLSESRDAEIRRDRYLENLREQAQKLQEISTLQIQEQADAERKRLSKEMLAALQRTDTVTKRPDENGIAKTAEDLDRSFAHAFDIAVELRQEHPLEITDPQFIEKTEEKQRKAEKALMKISRGREALNHAIALWQKHPLEEEAKEQKERNQCADRCSQMIAMILDTPVTNTLGKQLLALREQMRNPNIVAAWSEEELATHELRLRALCEMNDGEQEVQKIKKMGENLQKEIDVELGAGSVQETWITSKQLEITALEQDLAGSPESPKSGLLTHPICAEFGIADMVREYSEDLRKELKVYANPAITESTRRELCIEVGVKIKQLMMARDLLRNLERITDEMALRTGNESVIIMDPQAYETKFRVKNSRGCYLDGKIYMRSDTSNEERISLVHHEKGHFILSILTRQSLLFPDLIERKMDEISEEGIRKIMQQGKRWGLAPDAFEAQLEKQGQRLSPSLIGRRYKRALVEEAMVRKSLVLDPRQTVSAKDREVFDAMQPQQEMDVAMHMTEDEESPMDTSALETETTGKTEAPYNPGEDFEAIELMISQIESFGEVYPQYKKITSDIINPNDGYTAWITFIKKLYNAGTATSPVNNKTFSITDPQHSREFKNLVGNLKGHISKKHKEIKALDWQLSDVNSAKPVKKGKWYSDKLGIRWMSALDMMRVWKEFTEDIKGMYTTMQDQRTSEFKEKLFEKLPSKIFGVKIPIIGNYTERLPHYAERKRNSLELERVKKWEDSFTNLDSESLMELIGANPTKDQLRASIQLLEKKGRLNWADQRLWRALNKFSRYRMPIGPCERNEIIRDKWLQKLITDIWKDKEMFDEWKTGNDGSVKKHKSAFTATADNYSNLSGQAEHELKGMLEQYVHSRKHTPPLPLPEEVNPHHYEEILHYSMRNGKMTMESKFYYLIRGIAEGFIPIERLKVLAGQEGDVLIKFPFLDYFYRRHNTMKEIIHIADLITENKGPDDNYSPGVKMTLFVRHTILRDSKARERMSKAIARSSETLDHEDVPYICTDVDWIRMKSLSGVVSGERSKLTHEGAKNAYVGFNEKLKLYAYLAMMEERGEAKFTDADVRDMAETLTSYVVFDNQMMRASMVGESKVNLSEAHLDEAPVMEANYKTRDFRDRTRDFVSELAGDVGLEDGDLKIPGLSLSTFLASKERDEEGVVEEEAKKKVVRATEFFAKNFVRKICNNADALKKLLIKREKSKPFLDACGGITFEEYRKDYLLLNAGK